MLTFRVEKVNAQIITRSRSSGPANASAASNRTAGGIAGNDQLVSGKGTPEEIKEKMEQQLRLQRAAHKRAMENSKNPSNSNSPLTQIVKVSTNSTQGNI